jgi:hypothetical protein
MTVSGSLIDNNENDRFLASNGNRQRNPKSIVTGPEILKHFPLPIL